jgi:hypothetical protein
MDKTTLVDVDIESGTELIRTLDREKFPIKAALWLYDTEDSDWKLIISTPLVDEKGPRYGYKIIQRILSHNLDNINMSLADISLVSPRNPLIQTLESWMKIENVDSPLRLSRNVLNGIYIDEARIYRVRQ